nr:hypothetical protein [Burkholderiaceae bacterium]
IFTSTLLDFVVTPLVFWRFGKRAAERLVADAAAGDANDFHTTPPREGVLHA